MIKALDCFGTRIYGKHDYVEFPDKLIDKIESYGFKCEAGPLVNCTAWIELKRMLEGK